MQRSGVVDRRWRWEQDAFEYLVKRDNWTHSVHKDFYGCQYDLITRNVYNKYGAHKHSIKLDDSSRRLWIRKYWHKEWNLEDLNGR